MKILIIANNLEGNYDGIGKHARMVGHELVKQGCEVEYCTGTTWHCSKWQMVLSLKMTMAYLKAICKSLRHHYDYIDVEYPFQEYNPLFLFSHILLWLVTRFQPVKLAFSMHEHDRVQPLRRKVVDVLLYFSDIVFVSEKKYFASLKHYAHKMRLRIISAHGLNYCEGVKDWQNTNRYCYFGQVNSSKAFKEMLDAWDVFNRDGKYHLDVVSITDLTDWHLERHQRVEFHYNLSNEESGKVVSKANFSIIPVLPNIGLNNSTFLAAARCGCVPIGHFNGDLQPEKFVINTSDYSTNNFVQALQSSQQIEKEKLVAMSEAAQEFGKNYSVERTASMMKDAFEEFKR